MSDAPIEQLHRRGRGNYHRQSHIHSSTYFAIDERYRNQFF